MSSNSIAVKLFFPIWTILLLSMVGTALLFGQIPNPISLSLIDRLLIDVYSDTIIEVYDTLPEKDLKNWFLEIQKKNKTKFYLIESQGKIIGPTPVPQTIFSIKQKMLKGHQKNNPFKKDSYIISKLKKGANDKTYRLAIKENELPIATKIKIIGHFKYRVMFAFILSICISYLVSIVVSKRLLKIKPLIQSISKGNFSNDFKEEKKHKSDEIDELTEQLKEMAKKIEDLIHSKNRLLIDISHELRSPLGRQQAALEIAKVLYKDQNNEIIDKIELENNKLQGLINEILDFSQEVYSKKSLSIERFSLSHLIANIIEDTKYEFKDVVFHYSNDDDLFMEGEPRLIFRAIENIIRNAIKYGNKKNTVVDVSITETNECYAIQIGDNGPGIAEDNIEFIFSPFYREANAENSKKSGYGLGLSIARNAIERHKGTMSAKNKKDSGLLVSIKLPKIYKSSLE